MKKLGFLKSPWFHTLSDCEDSLLDPVFLWGSQFMINLPVFKENKFSYLYKSFVSVLMLEIIFPLNESKNCKIFLVLHCPLDHMTFYSNGNTCSIYANSS